MNITILTGLILLALAINPELFHNQDNALLILLWFAWVWGAAFDVINRRKS